MTCENLQSSELMSTAEFRTSVTVVINTYNDRKHVGRAIRSVLNQTREPSEVLLIDDGSTDGTGEFVRNDFGDRVRYHWHPNRGIAASRNLGIHLAAGEWIGFLDSDDYWAPEKLDLQLSAAREAPGAGMVACVGLVCTPEGAIVGKAGLPQPFTMKAVRAELRRRCILLFSGLLIRRDVMTQVGGFPEDLAFGEDLVTVAKIAAAFEITAVHQPLFYKTQLPQSLSSSPEAALSQGRISARRCREALARHSWPGNWLDELAFRQSEAQLFFHTAWLYAGIHDKRKAALAVIRGLVHWPFLTMWQYRSVYWLCARLLRREL